MAKTALVTGASSGIGLELAHFFAADKINLVLVARSAEKLELIAEELRNAYQIDVRVMVKDLAHPKTPDVIYDELSHDNIQIDYLVNNAGFGTYGRFVDLDLQRELDQIQVNVTALVHLSKVFGKDMAARRFGKILNVASTAGFQPGPLMAVYYAGKAFIIHFSEALNNELQDRGVSVTCLCPGPTKTNFQARAKNQKSSLFQTVVMPVEPVARAGYKAMLKGKPLVIPGFMFWIGAQLHRFAPRTIVTRVSRKILDPA